MSLRHSIVLSTLILAGCDDTISLNKICDQTPGLCQDLNKDGRCKEQRADVIYARYHEYRAPVDENKYQLLKNFEKYNQCVSLASQIEHIKLKEKKTTRVEGHLTALKEMTRLYQETKNTTHPGLLYFHWSREGDIAALNKLLQMENDPDVLNNLEIQKFLATYYAKIDDNKTIDILYRVLELNESGQLPDPEIFSSLVSIFYKQEKFKHAYTFARVAQMSGFQDIDIFSVKEHLLANNRDLNALEALAKKTYDSIYNGTFVSPRDF